MTPDELRALADEATPGSRTVREDPGSSLYDARARLIALAPDLARLCAELSEALDRFWAGNDEGLNETRAALAKLSELEAR